MTPQRTRSQLDVGARIVRLELGQLADDLRQLAPALDGDLDKEVNALIEQGYQPYGSPYVFQDIELFACQPMVLYEETPEPPV